jgi:carboxylesterase
MRSELSFAQAFQAPEHEPFVMPGNNECAVVLVHGFPGTPAEMRPFAAGLHQHGYTVICPLLPGFGPQIETLAKYGNADWLQHVLATCQKYRSSYAHITLIGHSLGGALAVQAAAQMPFDALVLLAPFWRLDHILWYALPLIRRVIPTFRPFRLFKPDFSSHEFRESVRNFLPDADLDNETVRQQIADLRLPLRVFDEIRSAGHKGHAARARIGCPVLVVQGRQDPLVVPAQTRKYTANWPIAQYCEVDAAHDLVQDENARSQVMPLILSFIAKGAHV